MLTGKVAAEAVSKIEDTKEGAEATMIGPGLTEAISKRIEDAEAMVAVEEAMEAEAEAEVETVAEVIAAEAREVDSLRGQCLHVCSQVNQFHW